MKNPHAPINPQPTVVDTFHCPSYGADFVLVNLHFNGLSVITVYMKHGTTLPEYDTRGKVMNYADADATWGNLKIAALAEAQGTHTDVMAMFIDMLPPNNMEYGVKEAEHDDR